MGLDFGSTASKGIILKDGNEIIASSIVPFGTGTSGPDKVKEELFSKSGLSSKDIDNTVVTGYGRMKYKAEEDTQISELSCHAKGVNFNLPDVRTIIDIGGQDAKAIRLSDKGKMTNFVMNDKCAAGTGRFLDVMSNILMVEVSELGDIDKKSNNPVAISSTCTVFAESEVISQLSGDAKLEDVVAGIHVSVAKRVSGLVKRIGVKEDVAMVGGVAQNSGVVRALERA
ncbi:MAG: acyl-CoA dehydratase activase, partial [Anaerococcus sp.]